jgi:NADH-quinone oxidoreductase subunit G
VEDVFKRITTEVPALAGLSFATVGELGLQVIETSETIPLLEREKERKAKGIIVG